jgi:hypothetical protein
MRSKRKTKEQRRKHPPPRLGKNSTILVLEPVKLAKMPSQQEISPIWLIYQEINSKKNQTGLHRV